MRRLRNKGGLILVLLAVSVCSCIAQKPLGVTFTEGGKGAGIASGLVEKTATATPATISSVANNIGQALTILEFTAKENGSRDGYPFEIKTLRFTLTGTADPADLRFILEGPGSNNTVASISGNVVTFTDFGNIIVTDGDPTGKTYQLKGQIRAAKNGTTTEGQTIAVSFNPQADIDVAEASSNIQPNVSSFTSGAMAIDIVATHLRGQGTFQFASVPRNTDFPGTQYIYAQDVNERVDKDFNFVIQLVPRSGIACVSGVSGNLTSTDVGLSKAAVQGVASWSDLKYDAIETIKIYASAPTATPALTQNECTASFDVTGP